MIIDILKQDEDYFIQSSWYKTCILYKLDCMV